MKPIVKDKPTEVRFILLDLENLAFLATNLQPLIYCCRHFGIEFRAYTAPDHEWADRATHHSLSTVKEAVDVRMIYDACAMLHRDRDEERKSCRILIITDDTTFGAAIKAEVHQVDRVAYDERLPDLWAPIFGVFETVEAFFSAHDVVRERRGRSASQMAQQPRGPA